MGETDFEALGLKLPGLEEKEVKVKVKESKRDDVKALKQELKTAVKNEEFEKAAELRDKIYFMEKNKKEGNE
jgi:protein-arginine kinase activator protein McsA